MKKSFKTSFAVFLSVLTFSFLSCNDVIFSDIRNEVKLNDATVSGSIQSIIRYKNNIFVANGRIYCQPKTTTAAGNWQELSYMPDTTANIYNLAADNDCLYAVSLSYVDDDDGYNVGNERQLWRGTLTEDSDGNITGATWECLLTLDYSSTEFLIFCTNTPLDSNRTAFSDTEMLFSNFQARLRPNKQIQVHGPKFQPAIIFPWRTAETFQTFAAQLTLPIKA